MQSRTRNSKRNAIIGLSLTIIVTIFSFVTRTIFIQNLGKDFLGINSLFSEIMSMMSLAELGFGIAIIYKLYKPFIDNDFEKISQYMNLYKKIYIIVAGVVLVIGAILMFFIQFFVNDISVSINELRLIFMLFVIQSASSYLFSYKAAVLTADQKQFVVSIITSITKVIVSIISIITLIIFKNYILYLCLIIFQNLSINIAISIYVTRKYPQINFKLKLSNDEKKETFKDVKNIFVKKISGVITSSTDNILTSVLVSTTLVGYYSNYVLILSVVRLIKRELTTAISASIGNLSVSENNDKNIKVLKRLTFLYYVFALIMCAGLMALANEFITVWLGADFLLGKSIVFVIIFNLFLEICCDPLWQFLEVSGLFSLDKYIGIIGSVINLIISIILGLYLGIIGIFIGTVATQVIQLILKSILIFKKKYNTSAIKYLLIWTKNILVYGVLVVITIFLIDKINIDIFILRFVVKGGIAGIVAVLLGLLSYVKTDEINYLFVSVKNKLHLRKED